MTKQITKKWKDEEYHRSMLSNLLSKMNSIITKDVVIPDSSVLCEKKELKKEKNMYHASLSAPSLTLCWEVECISYRWVEMIVIWLLIIIFLLLMLVRIHQSYYQCC